MLLDYVFGFFTIVLLFLCVVTVFVILMQRGSSQGGLGTAFGGGAAESAFGAETSNVLSKFTVYFTIGFFVLSLGLYLGNIYAHNAEAVSEDRDIEGLTTGAAEISAAEAVEVEAATAAREEAAQEAAAEGETTVEDGSTSALELLEQAAREGMQEEGSQVPETIEPNLPGQDSSE